MVNKRREFRLPGETMELINRVKDEQGLSTGSEAVRYIVDSYFSQIEEDQNRDKRENEFADLVVDKIESRIGKTMDRIRLVSSTTEKNTTLTLDAINSMLHDSNTNMMMRANGPTMHRVIRESEKRYQARLERNAIVQGNSYPEIDRRKE